MQPLPSTTTSAHVTGKQCARQLREVIPLVMRTIRKNMRDTRMPELTVPQFRTLLFTKVEGVVTLSELAEFMGLALPSMSRLVDGLVVRKLMRRRAQSTDRRKLALEVTEAGEAMVAMADRMTQEKLAVVLEGASEEELRVISQGLAMLEKAFRGVGVDGADVKQNEQTDKSRRNV